MEPITRKQERFARHYCEQMREHPDREAAVLAYKAAYNTMPGTKRASVVAGAMASLNHPRIAARIDEIIGAVTVNHPAGLNVAKCLTAQVDLATADPNELVSVRVVCCRYCWGDEGRYQWREDEYFTAVRAAETAKLPLPEWNGGVGFKAWLEPNMDCDRCGGVGIPTVVVKPTESLSPGGRLLYRGAKMDAKGNVEVIMADQSKAWETIIRMQGGFKDGAADALAAVLLGNAGSSEALEKMRAGSLTPHDAELAYRDFMAGTSKPAGATTQ